VLSLGDDAGVQAALRAFELVLLREMGVLPELAVDTVTLQAVREDRRYTLHAEAGVVEAAAGEAGLRGGWLREAERALEALAQPQGLAALHQVCRKALSDLKPALRGLLHYHLGTPVLRTRQLLMELQQP
jgi:DNA repair protein RecO (recombination protein O)